MSLPKDDPAYARDPAQYGPDGELVEPAHYLARRLVRVDLRKRGIPLDLSDAEYERRGLDVSQLAAKLVSGRVAKLTDADFEAIALFCGHSDRSYYKAFGVREAERLGTPAWAQDARTWRPAPEAEGR